MKDFMKKVDRLLQNENLKEGIEIIKEYLQELDINCEYYLYNKHTEKAYCNSKSLGKEIEEYKIGVTETEYIYLKYDKSFLKTIIKMQKNMKKEITEIYLLLEILDNEITTELYQVTSFITPIYYEVYKIFFEEDKLITKKISEFTTLVNSILGIKITGIRRNEKIILEKKNKEEKTTYKNEELEIDWFVERKIGKEINYKKILIILFTIMDNFLSKEDLEKKRIELIEREKRSKKKLERLNIMLEENLYKSVVINNLYKKMSKTRDLKEAFIVLEKIIKKEIGYDYLKINCKNIIMEFGEKKESLISEEIKTSLKRIKEEYKIIYLKKNITMVEKKYLSLIFNNSKVEIENMLLYERIENLSQKDGITDLFIHRFFMDKLEKEIQIYYRQDCKLSLIMLDVDNFKRYNDEYGHQRGDEVLFDVAEAIRKNIRNIDIPCRYGGEEFIVILPFTDVKKATMVANRIRKYLEEKVDVTASFGVTEYMKSELQEEFIKRVDMAMYEAKKNGKNCVVRM